MRSTGYIKDGKYIKATPKVADMKEDRTVVDKQYSHDRQREQHRRDLLQPYINGKPNPEFMQQYGKEYYGNN